MACAECGAELRAGAKFCAACGTPAAPHCASCGAELRPGDRFCAECGTPVRDGAGPAGPAPATTRGAAPRGSEAGAERRLVSVLFADLVGFTTLSEHRDPEEIRELLSQYFDRCRALIERYGGTVEKFIGDAVMAVWGTPVAREDDAERAVRAALSLTAAVTALGAEVGMPELRVRAGILTGHAAVELGAEGEGMVLGDTVNTASRLQSIATPGTVLVDEVTRRASEAAIAYEDGGEHHVKGREQPVRTWTALRIVAGVGGSRRRAGLEAPLVGRAAELTRLIEAGEESATDGRARLVGLVGEAGSGKSRLLWEFFKYLDGISESRWWHTGRCLSYGEGVAYWALAEMVRARAGIAEEEPVAIARDKLRATVEQHVHEERERRLVEPRLAHLLRLEERPDADRADLFSGWRLFFERMAESGPVVLAFEDLQWADSGLLDFVDYLLEWSSDYPIYVIALGRSELRDRRPHWAPLVLDQLPPTAIAEILGGLVPGLPDELTAEIARRAEGIPLYAVETVRMLLDRGLLVQEGSRYALSGEVGELEVPETLQALVASRLDGLSSEERGLLQNASVLGQTFTPAALAALSDRREPEIVALLDGLVAKQILGFDADPRSPERGQYAFLQGLLRTVAYGTLSRRTRKSRHLAAAAYLRQTWPGEQADIAEVLAAHYLEAINADPDARDVASLRDAARGTLAAAGQASASMTLGVEADRYFAQAAELADDELEQAELLGQAGRALSRAGDEPAAEARLRQAVDLFRSRGHATGGRPAVDLAQLLRVSGRLDEAIAMLAPFESAAESEDRVLGALALVGMGLNHTFAGNLDSAGPLLEQALSVLEAQEELPGLAEALISRGVFLAMSQRTQEAIAVLRQGAAIAEEQDIPSLRVRALYNLAGVRVEQHRLREAVREVDEALVRVRELGDRSWERRLRQQKHIPLALVGEWDDALAVVDETLATGSRYDAINAAMSSAFIGWGRRDATRLSMVLKLTQGAVDETYLEVRSAALCATALVSLAGGKPDQTLGLAEQLLAADSIAAEIRALGYFVYTEAALARDDPEVLTGLRARIESLPPVLARPLVKAQGLRVEAELASRSGDIAASKAAAARAVEILRDVETRPLIARALIDQWRRHADEDALGEARAILDELGAEGWLAKLPAPVSGAAGALPG